MAASRIVGVQPLVWVICPKSRGRAELFSNDFEGELNGNFFVETKSSVVVAHFFNGFFNFDHLAIHVEAEFFESFSDLNSVDGSEDGSGRACFSTECELNILQRSSEGFSISFDFSELVGALALVCEKS